MYLCEFRTMAKTRQKRGHHCLWSESAMTSAIQAVQNQQMSQRAACKTFGVPRCTLQMRLLGKTELGAKPGHPTSFSFEQEEKLVDYACNRASMGIGFGRRQLLSYAGKFAAKHKVQFKHGIPSKQWWGGLKKRHARVTLRQPEGTAAIRHQCMERTKVDKYFSALKAVLDEHNLHVKPTSIWNMDETGLQLDHKPPKVIATKGTRHLHSRTSGNREMITVIGVVNAVGGALPPHVIIKGKTRRSLNSFQTHDAPDGTTWSWSDNGWTKQGIALLWFTKSFLPSIGSDRPQVLILDGHNSHNFLELLDIAVDNNIHIVELPAHTSNWLQPCDRSVFGPFKTAYRKACDDLMSTFPGSLVSRATFCGLLNKAWADAVTSTNIISGFRACGIHPYNPGAVPQEAYIPSSLYSSMNTPSVPGCSQQPNAGNQTSGSSGPQLVTPSTSTSSAVSTFVAVDDPAPVMITSLHTTVPLQAAISFAEENDDVSAHTALSDSFHLSDYVLDESQTITTVATVTPPEIALDLCESSLLPEQLECYKYCLSKQFDLTKDEAFVAWKTLKQQCENGLSDTDASVSVTDLGISVSDLDVTNFVVDDDAGDLSGGTLSLSGPVHSEQPCASSNSENSFQPASFNNSSYPGDPDSDVLSYPAPIIKRKKAAHTQKFFLLTSKEARTAKLKEIQEKAAKEEIKKAKQEARSKKQEVKLQRKDDHSTSQDKLEGCRAERKSRLSKQNKSKNCHQELQENRQPKSNRKQKNTPTSECVKKRKVGIPKRKVAEDLTPCAACSVRYCDSADQNWIQCQECDAWYHNSCQGLDEKGPDTFICISCDD